MIVPARLADLPGLGSDILQGKVKDRLVVDVNEQRSRALFAIAREVTADLVDAGLGRPDPIAKLERP